MSGILLRAAFTMLAAGLCSTRGAAQTPLMLVGIVRGSDHVGKAPANWQVTISIVGGAPGTSKNSLGEIYVIPRPPGPASLELYYVAPGYNERSLPVNTTGKSFAYRPLPDIDLPKIKKVAGLTAGQLQQQLLESAELARRAGPEAIEIFRWNLEVYQHVYRQDTDKLRALDEFRARPELTPILSPLEAPDASIYRRIIEWQSGDVTELPTSDLLRIVRARGLPSSIRLEAAAALRSPSLAGPERATAISTVQDLLGDEAIAGLEPAVVGVLAALGDGDARLRIVNDLRATEDERIWNAFAALEFTSVAGAEPELIRISRSHPDVNLRAGAMERLGASTNGPAVQTLLTSLRVDTEPEVRVSAARALGEILLRSGSAPNVTSALQDAVRGDSAVEVRVEAQRALSGP